MNLALYVRSNDLISAALNGEIDFEDLEIELVAIIAELDLRHDALVERHVAGAILVLAEMDRGDRTKESVADALRLLIEEAGKLDLVHSASLSKR